MNFQIDNKQYQILYKELNYYQFKNKMIKCYITLRLKNQLFKEIVKYYIIR